MSRVFIQKSNECLQLHGFTLLNFFVTSLYFKTLLARKLQPMNWALDLLVHLPMESSPTLMVLVSVFSRNDYNLGLICITQITYDHIFCFIFFFCPFFSGSVSHKSSKSKDHVVKPRSPSGVTSGSSSRFTVSPADDPHLMWHTTVP